jgi:hypothetical protein
VKTESDRPCQDLAITLIDIAEVSSMAENANPIHHGAF